MAADNDRAPHENVQAWTVHTEDVEGDYQAVLGKTSIRLPNGDFLSDVYAFVSPIDGALVVQVDTSTQHAVPLRVNINDNRPSLFDDTVTPERKDQPMHPLERLDQQFTRMNAILDDLPIKQARTLLAEHGNAAEAYAVLATRAAKRLGCTTPGQVRAAQLLAAAALRLAQLDTDSPSGEVADTSREPLLTIDGMIILLHEMRARSPLGGETVLYWSEENRPVVAVGHVRVDSDGDGAIVEVSP